MQRANPFHVERAYLFQQSLNLHSVLAHYSEVISSCLASPVFFYVECAEKFKNIAYAETTVTLKGKMTETNKKEIIGLAKELCLGYNSNKE